jgi:SsrA-binding protein
MKQKGFTLIPLKVYFVRGRVKIELALASGKKNYDKRQDLADKASKRDVERALKERQRDY